VQDTGCLTNLSINGESPRNLPSVTTALIISVLRTGVKIGLATVHFRGFGVARAGPWNTWVNKGKKKGRGPT
jgi:hypothetical protein